MSRILVVEDDKDVLKAVSRVLEREGHRMVGIESGEALWDAIKRFGPELILLDIGLPDADGRDLLRELKARPDTRQILVILLTGLDSEADRALGLDLGAEDYIVKPFGPYELAARIRARLRPASGAVAAGVVVKKGALTLDGPNRTVRLGRQSLKLQPKEFEILYLLASHPGRLLTRRFLLESTSPYGSEVSGRSLDTHIKNIRKKLGAYSRHIETVPKLGYRFTLPD